MPSQSVHPAPRGAGFRFPALLWALLHVPIILALFASSISQTLRGVPTGYRGWLLPTYPVQAMVVATAMFLIGLPLSFWPGLYRRAAPALMALATAVVALDSRVYAMVAFHLNGFFFKVLAQRNALKETGVPTSDVVLFLSVAAIWLVLEVALGGRFLARFATTRRRTWAWVLGLLLLGTTERFYSGTLTYYGGQAIFAASGVLPLVAPIRMTGVVEQVTGVKQTDPFSRSGTEAVRLPPILAPSAVTVARRPDILFILAESLPAEHLDERTMPRLWARAAGGARFTRHYSGASSTYYTLFSLLYGFQAQKLDATVGAGRGTLLFPVLRDAGYQIRILASSCVDWMGLKETVFGQVAGDMETWCDSTDWDNLDPLLIAGAHRWVDAADDRPVFMFMFLNGTHFNYYFPDSQAVIRPYWDGRGGLKTQGTPPEQIQNRARNAAHFLDGEVDQLISDIARRRGRKPLVLFTGDHGEEFRQKGHMGHGSAVTNEQIHVPMVIFGDGVQPGVFDAPTSHSDLVPTLFQLLGDRHPPALYSDGLSMFQAPDDRFVVSTVGWEPHYAAIGKELKVTMYAGLGSAAVTDPEDRPLPDASERLARSAGRIMRALRGEADSIAAQSP
jgi:hypothetical protein